MNADHLMPRPSALYGFARVLDLFGRVDRFNDSPTPEAADRAGLRCDWEMIKGDLAKARQLLVAQDPEARDVVKALESVESHVIHTRVRLGGSAALRHQMLLTRRRPADTV